MLKIPQQYSSLEYIEPIKWENIFAKWREGEAWQECWKKHWKERGFKSWDEWRKAYAAPLKPETLEWFLYRIKDPLKDLPLFYGAPSHSWVEKAYGGKVTKQLKDITDLPIISENSKVLDIKKDFPEKTMLTGIIHEDKIVLVEGMHRASALASWNPKVSLKSDVTLALAKWENEIPKIGGNIK